MTAQTTAQQLLPFIQKWIGVGNAGDTPQNKGQCVGLIELWTDLMKYPHIPGNAVDLLANADKSHYTLIANSPTNYPPPGAIVCWGASWGAGYGHTAVVVAASDVELGVFEQNDPEGSPPVLATHGYSGVVGWLVMK